MKYIIEFEDTPDSKLNGEHVYRCKNIPELLWNRERLERLEPLNTSALYSAMLESKRLANLMEGLLHVEN